MRALLLADGQATRWTSPTPKHLVTIDGEVLLSRTVRQLRERGLRDVWITSHNPQYRVPGTRRYEPANNIHKIDQFYACRELWAALKADVVFLYADVWFSDSAMDTIVNHPTTDVSYFQRTGKSLITGKPWKEGFAMKVRNKDKFLSVLETIRFEIESGRQTDQHHQIQGFIEGHGTGEYFEAVIGPHGVEIDDETDDFDTPDDIAIWERYVAAYRQQSQSQVPSSSCTPTGARSDP